MELINFPAWIEQQKVLTSAGVDTANDQIIIGKKVNDKRDGSQYQAFAMSIDEFLALVPTYVPPAPAYKFLVANIYQSGTDSIKFVDKNGAENPFQNTLGEVPTLSRDVAGRYFIDVVANLFEKTYVHFAGNTTANAGSTALTIVSTTTGLPVGTLSLFCANTGTRLILECRDLTGTLVDISTLIATNPISLPEIRVY